MKFRLLPTLICLAWATSGLAQPSREAVYGDVGRANLAELLVPTPATLVAPAFLPGRGTISSAVPASVRGRAALSSFQLQFTESDRKINALGVRLDGARAHLHLRDMDASDSFGGTATWYQSANLSPTREIWQVGNGEFIMELPNPPAGQVALLKGFSFARRDGTDANVRLIAVQMLEDNRRVRVALVDDQGTDFRSLVETTSQAFMVAAFPFGAAVSPLMVGFQAAIEMNEFGGNRMRNFRVGIQYVFAPRGSVLGISSVSGASRSADSGQLPAAQDKVALRGFRFMFGNSDHHIKKFGVNLQAPPGQPIVEFQDNGTDDPIAWSVDYARLR